MNPKEKAIELIALFTYNCKECDNAKLSALKAVDEIIETHPEVMCVINFWEEVKKEIEEL